jgi:hypothetical protein
MDEPLANSPDLTYRTAPEVESALTELTALIKFPGRKQVDAVPDRVQFEPQRAAEVLNRPA